MVRQCVQQNSSSSAQWMSPDTGHCIDARLIDVWQQVQYTVQNHHSEVLNIISLRYVTLVYAVIRGIKGFKLVWS